MTKIFFLIICFLTFSTGFCADEGPNSIVIDNFESGIHDWQEKQFFGNTRYSVVPDSGNSMVLQASSQSSASGLVKEISFNPGEFPFLSWRWNITRTLPKGNATIKEGDDYAARVYVIFPHWIKPLSRTINYIWANRLAVGEAVPNTYLSRAMMVAVESGDSKAGQWITETRNVFEDYQDLFGESPPQAGAIAIMTDTDNTGDEVQAWYDDIIILSAPLSR